MVFRSNQIIADVAEQPQHLGLVAVKPTVPRLAWQLIVQDQYVAVLPAEHPLAQRGAGAPIALEALAHEGLVLPPCGFDLREAVDIAAAGHRGNVTSLCVARSGACIWRMPRSSGPMLLVRPGINPRKSHHSV